jgi:dienelactone hydrolase
MKWAGLVAGLVVCIALLSSRAFGQKEVAFPLVAGTGRVVADLYGQGDGQGAKGLILAHGGRFHKESWKKQAQVFAEHGFLVLALGFRGDRANPDGSPGTFGPYEDNTADVMAAVAYLHHIGAKSVSAVGGSLGGDAVGNADVALGPGSFERIVILAAEGGDAPEKLTGRKLFLVARDDRSGDGLRLPGISKSFGKAPEPKRLVVVDGSAHAQFLFDTDQGPRVMEEMLRFLTGP